MPKKKTSKTDSAPAVDRAAPCCAVGGDFYKGLEWFACWLLDHAEGETITEELLRPWAQQAWMKHLKRHNVAHEPRPTDRRTDDER